QLPPLGVEQLYAQSLYQTCAGVVAGAAAKPHDDVCGAGLDGLDDQLPYAEAAGLQYLTVLRRNLLEAGGSGHLDKGPAVAQPAPRSLHGLPVGVAYGGDTAFSAAGRQHGVQRTFASVRHGNANRFRLRTSVFDSLRNRLGNAGC